MKRALCSLGLLLAAGCIIVPEGVIYGNGQQTLRTRGVSDFYTIDNRTNVPVRVREASRYEVLTTIDSNLQDLLRVERDGDVLRIDVSPHASIAPTGHPLVDVTMPSFEGASVSGSGPIDVSGVTGAKDLVLSVYGSGGLGFDGTANRITATTAGSGDLHLSGSANVLIATVNGSGSIDARYLQADDADLTTTGSGSIRALVMGGNIWCRIMGSGDIEYWGSGVIRLLQDTGSGHLYYRGGGLD